MSANEIEIKPLTTALGAEIFGVNLAQPMDHETFRVIHQALLAHLVIFFRNQSITPVQQKEFARHFGELVVHEYKPGQATIVGMEGHPEVVEFVKDEGDKFNVGNAWHTDVTYFEKPPLGSVLYGIEVPPAGGDTMWSNQYLAYETLSEGMRAFLDTQTAIHSDIGPSLLVSYENRGQRNTSSAAIDGEEERRSEHPAVRTHPETGRRALFVNASYTIKFKGMTVAESRPVLQALYDHAVRPEFTCRFRWQSGSVAMWDNRCTLHYAMNDYHGQRRVVRRVTIIGDRPY